MHLHKTALRWLNPNLAALADWTGKIHAPEGVGSVFHVSEQSKTVSLDPLRNDVIDLVIWVVQEAALASLTPKLSGLRGRDV